MAGTTIQRVVSLGKETTWGTAVARTVKLMQITAEPQAAPQVDRSRNRSQGSFAPATSSKVNKAGAALTISGRVTYEDLALYWQNAVGLVFPSPNTTPYPRLYDFPLSSKPTAYPYTAEIGDPTNIYTLAGLLPTQLEVAGDFDANEADWTFTHAYLAKSKTAVSNNDEQQTITVTGTPAGGTFKLAFQGVETTATMAYNETAANVQTQLRTITPLAGVTVSGSTGGPWTVTFAGGTVTGTDVPLLVLSTNSLTGGTSPSLTIAETVRGGGQTLLADRTVEKIGMDSTHFYADALGGTIGTTEVTAALVSFALRITTGYHAKFFAGSAFAQGFGYGPWDAQLRTRFEYTAAVKAFVDSILGGTAVERLIRLGATGTSSKAVNFDGAYSLAAPPDVTDREGNSTIELTWDALNSVAAGYWNRMTLSNALATLAA